MYANVLRHSKQIISLAQDGKSNIWSIEPKMVVEEETEGGDSEGPNKNVVVFGIIIAAAIISLPLFTFFSTLVPDPADF